MLVPAAATYDRQAAEETPRATAFRNACLLDGSFPCAPA
jgi:hypothetical protein